MSAPTRIRRTGPARRTLLAWLVVSGLLAGPAVVAEEVPAVVVAEEVTDVTNAIWKDQEITFSYRSRNNIYSCDALGSRVESLLRAVGAEQESLEVEVRNCSDFFLDPLIDDPPLRNQSRSIADQVRNRRLQALRNAQFSQVRIRVRSPIPATPEALAELEKTKPYRELLGRVTGSSAALQEAASQFPARRQNISLSTRKLDLEPEECELLEQMITDVFPKLGVTVTKKSISCFPTSQSLIKPKVEVEALIRTPPPPPPTG